MSHTSCKINMFIIHNVTISASGDTCLPVSSAASHASCDFLPVFDITDSSMTKGQKLVADGAVGIGLVHILTHSQSLVSISASVFL